MLRDVCIHLFNGPCSTCVTDIVTVTVISLCDVRFVWGGSVGGWVGVAGVHLYSCV